MRFTEHELTAAVTGTAKAVLASKRKIRKRGNIDEVWDQMDRYQRFKLLDAIGSQILPVLVALPEVDVEPGMRPTYTPQQVQETVTGLVDAQLGKVRRLAVIKTRTALVQTALANVPPRVDPDALTHGSE